MVFLRTLFLLSCIGCVVLAAWLASWEGRAIRPGHIWILDLRPSPLWAPPPTPTFEDFRKVFSDSDDFPAKASEVRIVRHLRLDFMLFDSLRWFWLVSLVCGCFYALTRGDEVDFVLHLAGWAGLGISAGAASSILLWVLFGGWCPPLPALFAVGGLAGGIAMGFLRPVGKGQRPSPSLVQKKYFGGDC